MMLLPNSKKSATIVISKPKIDPDRMKFIHAILGKSMPEDTVKEEKEVDMNMPEKDYAMGREAAAEEMIKAFHMKDAKALSSALHDFFHLMESYKDNKGEEHNSMESGMEY